MTPEQKEHVQDCIEIEGFEYTFIHYSSFKDIDDEEFHKLRLAYKEAQQKLQEYLEM